MFILETFVPETFVHERNTIQRKIAIVSDFTYIVCENITTESFL